MRIRLVPVGDDNRASRARLLSARTESPWASAYLPFAPEKKEPAERYWLWRFMNIIGEADYGKRKRHHQGRTHFSGRIY